MMQNNRWLDEMYARAQQDAWYRECLAQVEQTEPAFERIREKLTLREQEELDSYISACEELQHSLIYLAYESGKTDRGG